MPSFLSKIVSVFKPKAVKSEVDLLLEALPKGSEAAQALELGLAVFHKIALAVDTTKAAAKEKGQNIELDLQDVLAIKDLVSTVLPILKLITESRSASAAPVLAVA